VSLYRDISALLKLYVEESESDACEASELNMPRATRCQPRKNFETPTGSSAVTR
jgi:hypothetical protein